MDMRQDCGQIKMVRNFSLLACLSVSFVLMLALHLVEFNTLSPKFDTIKEYRRILHKKYNEESGMAVTAK